jgi:cyclic pyranopterin phosphate synthase
LVRKGAVDFIQRLKTIEGIERVTMTSNAILLDEYLDELSDLDGINISLDTLDPAVFRRITGSDGLEQIQAVLKRLASRVPGTGMPVKINCVPIQGLNEGDIVSLAKLAQSENIAVRFIELMPIGCATALTPVPATSIIAMLEKAFGALKPYAGRLGNGPAVYYSIDGFAGKVGVIAALSKPFCEGCNRLRLTSTGLLKPCLSSDMVLDLKALLRGGATDGAIVEAVRGLVAEKPLGHSFGRGAEGHGEMFRVGG